MKKFEQTDGMQSTTDDTSRSVQQSEPSSCAHSQATTKNCHFYTPTRIELLTKLDW